MAGIDSVTQASHQHNGTDLLGLPDKARQDHRITKKMLAEQFEERTPADARLIAKAVATARLVGILRPETIQVPKYQDGERIVVDIPVIEAVLTEKTTTADRTHVAELIHRSMAKPVVLIMVMPEGTAMLSIALSHVNRTDSTQSTSAIDAHLMVSVSEIEAGALHVVRLDHTDMWALYRDLVRMAATGGHPASAALQAADAIAVRRRLADLETELTRVTRDVRQAKNQQVRIDLNMRARTLRAQIGRARAALYDY
jgi:Domain of unknown function (DUF4391)